VTVLTQGFLRQVAEQAQAEGDRLRAEWRAATAWPTPLLAEEAAAFLGLAEAARQALRVLDARPEPSALELDRALVARLVAIEDGLSEWEVGFVESLSKWVESQPLTAPQRERAEQIDRERR
jgi:hypothetical protein